MTKANIRTGNPVPVQAPWNPNPPPTAEQVAAAGQVDELADIFESAPEGSSTPTNVVNDPIPPSPEERAAAIRASLGNDVVAQKSPFAPKPKAKSNTKEVEVFEMGDAPLWGDLVKFCQKHGDVIIQARHPQPRGEAIDTVWRGVTVFAHATTEVRHIKHGWVTWADAQYEG